jgi:hypothetical protein
MAATVANILNCTEKWQRSRHIRIFGIHLLGAQVWQMFQVKRHAGLHDLFRIIPKQCLKKELVASRTPPTISHMNQDH